MVGWDWATANVHDGAFLPLAAAQFDGATIVLADTGFRARRAGTRQPESCARGAPGTRRMLVETALSLRDHGLSG